MNSWGTPIVHFPKSHLYFMNCSWKFMHWAYEPFKNCSSWTFVNCSSWTFVNWSLWTLLNCSSWSFMSAVHSWTAVHELSWTPVHELLWITVHKFSWTGVHELSWTWVSEPSWFYVHESFMNSHCLFSICHLYFINCSWTVYMNWVHKPFLNFIAGVRPNPFYKKLKTKKALCNCAQ